MWEIIQSNRRKSAILVVVMAGLLIAIGYLAGELLVGPGMGVSGIAVAAVVWIILSLVAYFQGRTIFLAVSGATKISKEDHPKLFNVVEEMTIASMLPSMPDIYIIDDPAPNAFSIGRDPAHAAVAITSGLLNMLDRDELQGVMAHEIAHVRNRDILFMTMIGVMMGAIVLIADITVRSLFYGGGRRRSRSSDSGQAQIIILVVGLALMILAPILARLIYMAASRKREYLADASAVEFTRLPDGLARALEKIGLSVLKSPRINRVVAPMCVVNPLEKTRSVQGLFSTHPPVTERVRILREMNAGPGVSGTFLQSYDQAFRKVTGAKTSSIPASALAQISAILPAAIAGGAGGDESSIDRARETRDAIWKSKQYRYIACDCGASLKVPPACRLPRIRCLRCRTEHMMGDAQASAMSQAGVI